MVRMLSTVSLTNKGEYSRARGLLSTPPGVFRDILGEGPALLAGLGRRRENEGGYRALICEIHFLDYATIVEHSATIGGR